MTKLILSVIVVVGTAFIYVWKRYATNEAKVNEWLEEIEKLRNEENKALTAGDYVKYDRLVKHRVRLGKRISRYTKRQNRFS